MMNVVRSVLVALAVSLAANGTIVLDLDLPTSTITAGQDFTVTFNLLCSAAEPIGDVSYTLTASTAGLFTIFGRDYALSPLPDMTSTDAQVLAPAAAALLNPTNGRDLGASGVPVVAASIFLCTLDLHSSGLAAGQYTFTPSDFSVGSGAPGFVEYDDILVSGETLTVNPVPEPGSVALLLLTLPSALLLRRRRS